MESKPKIFEQRFEKVEYINGGSYGTVYKVKLKSDPKRFFALKRFKENQDGLELSALREISILKEINHDNIEKIYDIFYDNKNLYVIYEFFDCSLEELIKKIELTKQDIKGVMFQILSGLAEIHNKGIIHRDLSISNILINKEGMVKIADFGLSRFIASPGKGMTKGVVTMNYRAPEIFFMAEFYSFSIDIWSAGCIFGEMLLREKLFTGKGEIEILRKIFCLLDVPNDTNWPNSKQLPRYQLFKFSNGGQAVTVRKKFEKFNEDCIDLLEKMLVLDPNKRITANEALKHPYFTNEPLPSSCEDIAKIMNDFKK